jgi:hypothetical protein
MTTTRLTLVAGALALAVGCTDSPTDTTETTTLLSVAPADGAIGIAVDTNVTITFSHAMSMGMEVYAALHEGDGVAGPLVEGTWHWSTDRTVLTFEPATPLMAHTTYTIHLGGGMTDGEGHVIDLERHQQHHGGQWVTQHMMDQRTMGGMHGGMMNDMTGPGWQHENGSYGMTFTFTTE